MAANEETTCGQRMSARCSNFAKFLYNSEEGKIVGRTPKSWALITVFYLIYYSCLAGFFVGMLSVLLFGVIENNTPRLTGDHSLLKMNPGLAMRPQPDVEKTLVAFDQKKPGSYQKHIESIKELMKSPENEKGIDAKPVACDFSKPQANENFDPTKKFCKFNMTEAWGKCNEKNEFGYKNGTPCVIVKMNKIFGWLPEIANSSEVKHATLECHGENDGDKPNIGKVNYYPSVKMGGKDFGYFGSANFPYLRQKGYVTPSVAVQFAGIAKNVLVMVECRLRNLENSVYDKLDRQAMVRFELLVFDGTMPADF